jgi:Protein of unknown function (DUF4232)
MILKRHYVTYGVFAGAILVLAGCSGAGTSAATSASAAAKDTSPPSAASPPASAAASSPAAGTAQSSAAGSGSSVSQCLTADLSVTATAAAGQPAAQVDVTFTNKGGSTCSLFGYPGVDLRTNDGTESVPRKSGATKTQVTLTPGQHTVAVIEYPANDSGGTGVSITSMVVTPPNETHSVTIEWPGGSLPVTDGSGSQTLDVSPVGSAS